MTPQEKRKDGELRRTYGITLEQYREILRKQQYRCKVCRRRFDEFPRALAVDHDHISGAIRGLLCTYCNQRVIGRHRDYKLLARASRYLKGPYTGFFVPKNRPKRRRRKKKE